MLGAVYHIAQEVDALTHGEHALVGLHLQVYLLHQFVYDVTHKPQFRFRFTEHDAVITIAVEMAHAVPVLQIVV